MAKNPLRPPQNDIQLSDEEIRAMAQDLRRQVAPDEPGIVGAVGSAVVGGVEGIIRQIIVLLRLPLIIAALVVGFLGFNGREGVSFFAAVAAGVIAAVIVAAVIGFVLRFLNMRQYRRDIR